MNINYYPTIGCALSSLRPGAVFTVRGSTYSGIEWLSKDQSKPTEDEVNAEISVLTQQWESKQYQRNRKEEYPDFVDYIDGLVKGDQDQMQAYIDACNAVKQKYPKPSQE
jgi:hypothetical protein